MVEYVCPTCKKRIRAARAEDVPNRPFCSARCRWIDLGKWLNEEYRISEPLDSAQILPGEADGEQH